MTCKIQNKQEQNKKTQKQPKPQLHTITNKLIEDTHLEQLLRLEKYYPL